MEIYEREKQIKRLQKNLSSIRKIAGWSMEELGDRIGAQKQTISNLENGKTKMSFTQYIAIRSILDCEIEERFEQDKEDILGRAMELLFAPDLDEENESKLSAALAAVATTVAGKLDSKVIKNTFKIMLGSHLGALVGGIPGAVAGGFVATKGSSWLKELMKKKEK